MISDQSVFVGTPAEKREAAGISQRNGKSGINERFPMISIMPEIPQGSPVPGFRDIPEMADPIASMPVVFRDRPA
jgi:hypothetical protein